MLTEGVVAQIKGMVARGDKQMDVAVFFGVNQGRVNELVRGTGSHGRRFRHVAPQTDNLPEPGPYKVVGVAGYERMREVAAIPASLLEMLLRDIALIKEMLSNGPDHHRAVECDAHTGSVHRALS